MTNSLAFQVESSTLSEAIKTAQVRAGLWFEEPPCCIAVEVVSTSVSLTPYVSTVSAEVSHDMERVRGGTPKCSRCGKRSA